LGTPKYNTGSSSINNLPKINIHVRSSSGVKGAVCGLRGTHLAGRCVPVKTWEMPFIPAKSEACMFTP